VARLSPISPPHPAPMRMARPIPADCCWLFNSR